MRGNSHVQFLGEGRSVMAVSYPTASLTPCTMKSPGSREPGLFCVRQAWRVARKRNPLGCGGQAGDLEVKVLYTPGKGKC